MKDINKKIAVSKATLTCVNINTFDKILKDIDKSIINANLIADCKLIIERLTKN